MECMSAHSHSDVHMFDLVCSTFVPNSAMLDKEANTGTGRAGGRRRTRRAASTAAGRTGEQDGMVLELGDSTANVMVVAVLAWWYCC